MTFEQWLKQCEGDLTPMGRLNSDLRDARLADFMPDGPRDADAYRVALLKFVAAHSFRVSLSSVMADFESSWFAYRAQRAAA